MLTDQGATTGTEAGAGAEASSASPPTQATTTSAPSAPVRPEGLADEFWDAEKGVKVDALTGKLKEWGDERQAEVDRKAALPKTAGDYKVELPEGFKLPEGTQVDDKDPAWGQFAEFAHKTGLTQEQFREAAGLYAGLQLQARAKQVEAAKAEFAKLGDNGKARVTALHQFIDASFKGDEAAAVKASLISSGAVVAWEKMQSALTSAGISFNQSGREGAVDPNKIEGYDGMSFTERFRNRKSA